MMQNLLETLRTSPPDLISALSSNMFSMINLTLVLVITAYKLWRRGRTFWNYVSLWSALIWIACFYLQFKSLIGSQATPYEVTWGSIIRSTMFVVWLLSVLMDLIGQSARNIALREQLKEVQTNDDLR